MTELKNGRTVMEEIIASAVGADGGYANLADDTGELDYEPSEPANSIKDAVSDDEEDDKSIGSSSTPRPAVRDSQVQSTVSADNHDDDLEEGEVDELEEGEVKEDSDDDNADIVPTKSSPARVVGQSLLTMKTKMPSSLNSSPLISVKSLNIVNNSGGNRDQNSRPEDVGICKFYIRGQYLHTQNSPDIQPVKLMTKQIPAPQPTSPLVKPHQQLQLRILPPPPQPPPVSVVTPAAAAVAKPPALSASGGNAETAWERGLKQAREMMRKANEKKENDADFEEKRINMPMDTVEVDRGDEPESPISLQQAPASLFDRQQSGRQSDTLPEMEPSLPVIRRDRLAQSSTGSTYMEDYDFGNAPRFDNFGFGRHHAPLNEKQEDNFLTRAPPGGFSGTGGRPVVEPFIGNFGRPPLPPMPPFCNIDLLKEEGQMGGGMVGSFNRPPPLGGAAMAEGGFGFVRPPMGERKPPQYIKRPYNERHWSRKQEFQQQHQQQQQQDQQPRDRDYGKAHNDDDNNASVENRFHKSRDTRDRIESKKDRGEDYVSRRHSNEKDRPLPYERPSYEGREWRDPWMRSSKMANKAAAAGGGYGVQDYTQSTTGGATSRRRSALVAERSAKYKRRRRSSFSGGSSSSGSRSRSSISSRTSSSRRSSKTLGSKSKSGSSSSTHSASSVGSGSSSRSSQPKRYDKTKFSDKKDKKQDTTEPVAMVEKEKISLKASPVIPTNRSLSPISKDSNSDSDLDERDKRVAGEKQTTNKTPNKESSQRKPIKLTIVNKSRIQVPVTYEEEINAHSRKFEPLSPESSSNDSFDSADERENLHKSPPPPPPPPLAGMEVEDISSQESDIEEEELEEEEEDDEDDDDQPSPQSSKKQNSPPKQSHKENNANAKEDSKTVISRRDELLKQLKAVEDAIAKKRRKVD